MVAGLLNWRANIRLEEKLSAIRAAGDPVTLAELNREPAPPEHNAVTHLRRVARQVATMNGQLKDAFQTPGPWRDEGKLNAVGLAKVREVFAEHPEVVPALVAAADCPTYDPGYAFDDRGADETGADDLGQPAVFVRVTEQPGPSRAVARLMMLQADVAIAEGQPDEAVQWCVRTLRYSRQLENEPFTVGFLVVLAVRSAALDKVNQTLRAGPISADGRQLLRQELEQVDDMSGFVRCLKQERVFGIASFRRMIPGKLPLWYARDWESDYLDVMATELRIGAEPKHRVSEALSTQQKQIASSSALARLVYPSLVAAREAMDRVRASTRCLIVLNSLQAAELDANEPPRADRLGLDAEHVTDPYDGEPLRIKHTPAGYVVYSVGRNGKDDGGAIGEPHLDIGAGPLAR